MGYTNPNELFQSESGRILPIFIERGRLRSWWASLGGNGIPSEPWPEEFGDTVSRNILERTIPTGGSGWQVVAQNALNTVSGGTCAQTPMALASASNLRTTQLEQNGIDSDIICVNDIRSKLQFKKDVAHVLKNFADNVADTWEAKNRDSYALYAQNHIVFNPQLPNKTNAASAYDFPSAVPTSPISQLYLDRLRIILKQNAAGMDGGAYGKEDGNDVFAVIMSTEQQQALFQMTAIVNTNGNGRINWDRRYAEPNKLLKAYGVNRSYAGWFHIIDDKAPRFTYANGVYTQVPYYASVAATKGNQAVVNPDYYNAPYEIVIPFVPTVLSRLVPRTFTSAGSGTWYKPWNYAGTPMWMNNFDRQYNPYFQNGYFSCQMQAGYLPELLDNGNIIMCARPCSSELEMTSCPGGS